MENFDSIESAVVPPVSLFETISRVFRLLVSIVGLILLFMGLNYSSKIFYGIYTGVQNPEQHQALLDRWVNVVGGNKLDVKIDGVTYSVARPLAIFVVGGALCILITIAITFMGTGAKIISMTTSDQEAIKKILTNAFGYLAVTNPPRQGNASKPTQKLPE